MRISLVCLSLLAALCSGAAAPDPNSALAKAGLWEGELRFRPELSGVHPRLLISREEGDVVRARYRAAPESFSSCLLPLESPELSEAPPATLSTSADAKWSTELVSLAASYYVTEDPRYLSALRSRIPALAEFVPVRFGKGSTMNADLFVGYTLRNLAITYDLVHGRDKELEHVLREFLLKQSRQAFMDLSNYRGLSYEQGHFTTPVAGLLMAALALYEEEPAASQWALLTSNILQRSYSILSPDGWFFEGISYWKYNLQCQFYASLALKAATGVNHFENPAALQFPRYLAHIYLPNPRFAFDFGDWGPRVNPDGVTAQAGYDWPWHTLPTDLSPIFPAIIERANSDPLIKHVRRFVSPSSKLFPFDKVWLMLWQLPVSEKSEPLPAAIPTWHYFADMDVVHWRSSWSDPDATAFAFKCGPPAGHNVGRLLPAYPEWRPNLGHVHPDAGTFTLYGRGAFLINGTAGYTRKVTGYTSTVLVDGRGQAREGTNFKAYEGLPYDQFKDVGVEKVWLNSEVVAARGHFGAAYPSELQMRAIVRTVVMVEGTFLVVHDSIRSAEPHVYEVRFHSDQAPQEQSPGAYLMTNGRGRLAIANLSKGTSARIMPTEVDTELYSEERKRIQQRGFHLALSSPRTASAAFTMAFAIEDSASQKTFTAKSVTDSKAVLNLGDSQCAIWTGSDAELSGDFAFVLAGEGKGVRSVGLSGKSLYTQELSITLESPGELVLSEQNGKWVVKSSSALPNRAKLVIHAATGRLETLIELPGGQPSK